MPNWNENRVTIHAPTDEVKTWLVAGSDDTYFFNMHRLYPERVPADDPCGDTTWDYDWFVENTGSKWPPFILLASNDDGQKTLLDYDTARTPNNLLLECWHRLTGWYMINEYEEWGLQVEGTFVCSDGDCRAVEGEYRPLCQVCDKKKPRAAYTIDPDVCVCDTCWNNEPISLTP